jgi:predicted dehydrogenase
MKIRFAAVGLNHGHIYGQVSTLLAAGAELAWVYADEPELLAQFQRKFPDCKVARSYQEILDDESVQVVTTAAIPSERAAVCIAAMRHDKDVLSDKPGFTTFEQLEETRRVQQETERIYSILFGERLENPATLRAGELVKNGAIGKVVQTMGWGPHRISLDARAPWFFEREKYGGILCDIGSHQCDQYLYFSGAREVEIQSAQVGNVVHAEYSELEDFGDATLRGRGEDGEVCGYFRVDWFTPDAMPAFGDGRLLVIGTEGTIEVRKYCDVGGREGGNHLFLVDKNSVRHFDCSQETSPFGANFVSDVLHRTETAISQQHCFAAAELALRVQAAAQRFGNLI